MTVGLLSFATLLSGFNGGRSQVNPNFLQISADYAFINHLKTAQSWSLGDNSGQPLPTDFDSNGYPLAGCDSITNHSGVFTVFFIPSAAELPGNWVITWTGNGTVSLGTANTPASGFTSANLTSTTGNGRYEFTTSATELNVGISAVGSPAITDLKVFNKSEEASQTAGNIFSTKFIARLKEANFGVIRFLNWTNANNANYTHWADRKPIGYVMYNDNELRASIYGGVTTNSGNAYSVAASPGWGGLVDKATITVKFNAAATQSGTCSLNVGGAGAINILDRYCQALSPDGQGNSYPTAGLFATLVYDINLNAWMKQGGDLANGSTYLVNGIPFEICLRLAAQVGAQPWFNIPHYALDIASDFAPGLSAYCLANGPSWMISRYEVGNEIWNQSGGVTNTWFAIHSAAARWAGGTLHDWVGMAASYLGQQLSSTYGGNHIKYKAIVGVQTALGFAAIDASIDERLKSTQFVNQVAAAISPWTKDHAYNWITTVANANYFGPTANYAAQGAIYAFDYSVTYAADPTNQAVTSAAYVATLLGAAGFANLAFVKSCVAAWKTWAAGMPTPVNEINFYEGGYSPDYLTINPTSAVDNIAPGSSTVLTLPYCIVNNNASDTNNMFAVRSTPMQLTVRNLSGTLGAALNGNSYNVTAVSGNTVTINANTTGLSLATVTISIGANAVATQTAHGYNFGDQAFFQTSGALPTGVAADTLYYVSPIDANTYHFSTTYGSSTTTSGSQSGTHVSSVGIDANNNGAVFMTNGATYFNALKLAGKSTPLLQTYLTQNYNDMIAAGGQFPSCFQMTGQLPSNNVWSVLEDIYQAPNPPQWLAIMTFNA